MADRDLLKVFDTSEVVVPAYRSQVEAGDAERLRPDLGVPGLEAAELVVGQAVGQPPRVDEIQVVDEEQEHVAVWGV